MTNIPVITIDPNGRTMGLEVRELFQYRDLFFFLVWRQIKVRYAQSSLGIGWAIAQPLFSMIVFTIIFGRVAKIDSDGAPYGLFSLAAILPWTYFSNAVNDGAGSLLAEANMIRKIYFPRLLLPLASIVAKLLDLLISLILLCVTLIFYQHSPSIGLCALPLLIASLLIAASGASIWLSAVSIQYRDVKYGLSFALQIGMYASPVIYSTYTLPEKYQYWFALNPLVGIIEAFRSMILGGPLPWSLLGIGVSSSLVILGTGLVYFRKREPIFADVS